MPLDPSYAVVKISSDRMEALLTLTDAAAAEGLSVDALKSYLAQQSVTQGLDLETLQQLVHSPQLNLPYLVAKGQAARDGTSEQMVYHFDVDPSVQLPEEAGGMINFHNIKNFNNTPAGTIIAEKTPAQPGKPGINVSGEEIKSRDGKQVTLRTGKGVKLSEDGTKVIAEVDGHACLVADRISVLNTVDIPAHVDYSIGNIKFIGNVNIRGGIMPGFSVEAQGDLSINENVEKADVTCGGNLAIRGIVFGQGDCHITANGDATVGAIDQAEVTVRGTLKVNNYITHSKVNVGQAIEVISKKGKIIGGEVRAFQGITAPFIGNAMATLTKLSVGNNPFVSLELSALQAQHDDVDNKLGQVMNAIRGALAKKSPTGEFPEGTKALLVKLQQAKAQLEPLLANLKQQLEEVQTRSAEFKSARIRVSEVIYPGVVINFRDRIQYKTMDEAQHCSFYEEAAEIRTGPL